LGGGRKHEGSVVRVRRRRAVNRLVAKSLAGAKLRLQEGLEKRRPVQEALQKPAGLSCATQTIAHMRLARWSCLRSI